ncbi:MAG: hypothetical protein GF332_00210, partial [Candidatus Moranbacteria bacterium]|nr:hypothetical protein [Candidatus Moranbacteria bacterium]
MSKIKKQLTKITIAATAILTMTANKASSTKSWNKSLNHVENTGIPGKNASITGTLRAIADAFLLALGSFAVIGFALSGILYLTAAGNEDRMETAKRGMIYSIIGVIVGMGGYFVLYVVDKMYRG